MIKIKSGGRFLCTIEILIEKSTSWGGWSSIEETLVYLSGSTRILNMMEASHDASISCAVNNAVKLKRKMER